MAPLDYRKVGMFCCGFFFIVEIEFGGITSARGIRSKAIAELKFCYEDVSFCLDSAPADGKLGISKVVLKKCGALRF